MRENTSKLNMCKAKSQVIIRIYHKRISDNSSVARDCTLNVQISYLLNPLVEMHACLSKK